MDRSGHNWFGHEPLPENIHRVFILVGLLLVASFSFQFLWNRRSRWHKLKLEDPSIAEKKHTDDACVAVVVDKVREAAVERGRRKPSADSLERAVRAEISPNTSDKPVSPAKAKETVASSVVPARDRTLSNQSRESRERAIPVWEVPKHKSRESAWIAVQGCVYDCTPWLDEHPGGASIILEAAGTDASEDFEAFHPPHAWAMLHDYCIGRLDCEAPPPPTAVLNTVASERENGKSSVPAKTVAPPLVDIPLNEVPKHRSRESAWIVVKGFVYDCTPFLDDHPGGSSIIVKAAGTDASEDFEAFHSPKAWTLLEDYRIGRLAAPKERSIALTEVKKHKSTQSAWIVVNDYVFDCTTFLDEHPAGSSIIVSAAGQDASSDFTAFHSTSAWTMLNDYRIGRLVDVAVETEEEPADDSNTFLRHGLVQKLPLREKIVVSHDTRIFRFGLPSAETTLGLPTGMHVLLRADVNGETVARQYTPITDDATLGHVDFLVKIYEKGKHPKFPLGGKMSQHLESLSLGDSIDCKGPIGDIIYKGRGVFTYKEEPRWCRHMSFIAGGTGLTPCYQIISAILRDPKDNTSISLLYANQSPSDILLRHELEVLAVDHSGRFRLWFTVDRVPDDIEWGYSVGFIDEDMIRSQIGNAAPDKCTFICGPPAMEKFACRPNLEKLGHTEDSIFVF